jgi:amidase
MADNTRQANLTGHPSMSVSCGIADGLPIGIMITGRRFDDAQVIAAVAVFESLGERRNM